MPEATEIALKYKTPRYLRIEHSENVVLSKQYNGLAPFFASGDNAPPVHERAPCITYGIVKNAIADLTDFIMGEGRYPQVSGGSSEDDEEIDDDWGLNEDESVTLEKWVNGPLTKAARLKAIFPDSIGMAMAGGAVAVLACVRNGIPTLVAMPAKWCTPEFDPVTDRVSKLTVFYPYLIDWQDPNTGKWEAKCRLYKRVIDDVSDTVYLPADGREDGLQPAWKPDERQTVRHGLGFCPVIWYAFDRPTPTAEHFDGQPIHHTLHNEVHAINMGMSQRHRAALYSGDPQLWETGVDPDVNPAPTGSFARAIVEPRAIGPGQVPVGIYTMRLPSGSGGGSARKKGPGIVWRYPNENSKVGMLSLEDGALDAMSEHLDDVRKKVAEDLSVVLIDPSEAATFGALSGKALAFLFARQVSRADRLRTDAGDKLMLASIDMLLRICVIIDQKRAGSLRIPGMKKLRSLFAKFETDVGLDNVPEDAPPDVPRTSKQWFGPRLELQWGRYFPPSAEEENFIVTMCAEALTAGLMPLEIIIEKLRDVFTFSSAEEILEKIEQESAKKQADAIALADHQGAVAAKYAPEGKQPAAKPGPPVPFRGSESGAKGDKKK